MKKINAISIPVLLIAAIMAGCSGKVTEPPVTTGSGYYVEAVIAKNLVNNLSTIMLTLDKNDTAYFDASVTFRGLPLDTNQSGYVRLFGATEILADSSYTLNIKDGDSLDVNLTVKIPGSFEIDGPAFRQFDGGAESVQWIPSIGSDGYILATVPPDTTVYYDGFEEYIAITEGAIPPETFLDGIDRILGTHRIFVAAYTGAPSASSILEFEIPETGGPVDNVSISGLSGRVAGMVIAVPDSIIVTE